MEASGSGPEDEAETLRERRVRELPIFSLVNPRASCKHGKEVE